MNWHCAHSSPTATAASGKLDRRTASASRAREHLIIAATMFREMHMRSGWRRRLGGD